MFVITGALVACTQKRRDGGPRSGREQRENEQEGHPADEPDPGWATALLDRDNGEEREGVAVAGGYITPLVRTAK
ncbi:MAG: hypothetical protein ACOCQL_03355 [Halolamina sp.]